MDGVVNSQRLYCSQKLVLNGSIKAYKGIYYSLFKGENLLNLISIKSYKYEYYV